MNCGAFAESVIVDQSQVVRIPKEIPLEKRQPVGLRRHHRIWCRYKHSQRALWQ